MNMKKGTLQFFIITIYLFTSVLSCSNGSGGGGGGSGSSLEAVADTPSETLSSYAPKHSNLRLSLTDAPKHDFKAVNVNIDKMELFLKKGATEKRLIIAQNTGMVNLLDLRNGVLLPLADVNLPEGVQITQIRLILNGQNNHSLFMDDRRCEMQTPSGQQSGVKIMLKTPITIENGFQYSMVVDFDAEKSVVVRGNKTCLLKPVIKLLTATKQPFPDDDGNTNPAPDNEEPITDGTDSNVNPDDQSNTNFLDENGFPIPPDQLGFDPYDPSTYPPEITIDDLWMYF